MPETTCVVPLCVNKGVHKFPKDKPRRDAWIHAIRRGKTKFDKWSPPSEFCYVCKQHFNDDDFSSLTFFGTERKRQTLKKTAVPSRFAWSGPVSSPKVRRAERVENRSCKRRKLFDDITNKTETEVFWATRIDINNIGAMEEVANSEESNLNCDDEQEPNALCCVTAQTQTPHRPMFSLDKFKDDEAGIHFYTGLETYVKLMFLLQTLGPAAYCLRYAHHQVSNIDVPDQFFMVLIKLRRHMTNIELSRLFGISESVVSNIFVTWMVFMYKQWREINIWPDQDLVMYFTPQGFKRSFPKTRVIIDGTECPVKKPKQPLSQQATFSTYKNRNTAIWLDAHRAVLCHLFRMHMGDQQVTDRL